jgi:hypothetical protein
VRGFLLLAILSLIYSRSSESIEQARSIIYIYGGASFNFSGYSQEAMECFEDQLLHDKEGTDIKEEDDHGHEFDDEERETAQKIIKQPH